MKNQEKLFDTIDNIIAREEYGSVAGIIYSELVETGVITNLTAKNILSGKLFAANLGVEICYWLYVSFAKYRADLPPVDTYFEEHEIGLSKRSKEKKSSKLVFDAVQLLPKEQFLLSVSAKDIYIAQENGSLKIDPSMQRESEIDLYNGQLISHVAYDDNRAREISNLLLSREYWSDSIRWNLVKDEEYSYEYDPVAKKIKINDGKLVILDGQHRTRAIEYAITNDPTLVYYFPVILTVGTIEEAQSIIAQHEKQQPINRDVVKSYQKSAANDILKVLMTDRKILRLYKFVNQIDAISMKVGFVFTTDILSAINKYYSPEKLSTNDKWKVADWLVDFFYEVGQIMEDDFTNYISVSAFKWSVSRHFFVALVWLSKELSNVSDWKEKLDSVLGSIDFGLSHRPWTVGTLRPENSIILIMKGVL